jgi:hypothetical protein
MSKQSIMVQIADRQWTLEALHRACPLALEKHASITLMKMLPVQHLSWLGTEFGAMSFTDRDRALMRDYEATIEDYGVPFSSDTFQYATLADAIVQAADYVEADIVFATLPNSIIPYWRRFQLWRLRKSLARHGLELIELDQRSPGRPDTMIASWPVPAHGLAHRKRIHP